MKGKETNIPTTPAACSPPIVRTAERINRSAKDASTSNSNSNTPYTRNGPKFLRQARNDRAIAAPGLACRNTTSAGANQVALAMTNITAKVTMLGIVNSFSARNSAS